MSAADRMAALKARVALAIGNSKGSLASVPIHPALENLDVPPKPATHGGSKTSDNPYFDPSQASRRQSRRLIFNQRGKYIQQANALRRQAALEAIKKRVAEQTRKAGIDEVPGDKNFVREAPPVVEWFDQGYFRDGKTYDNLDSPDNLKLEGMDSIITDLVQHPIPIPPPQEKLAPEPKPMYLTRKEQKKIRRQRRMADLKETQAKIRLGLVPVPEPKVKKSNLMRVLGEEAVQDPTAVEARVNRQIAERRQKHVDANEERKLTKEQRHEKLATNQQKDAAKGIHILVFRIDSLANGQHRFKIAKNAEQHALTGVCLMHPKINLVIVEGGEYSISKYKKLMLNRIDWTQGAPPGSAASESTESGSATPNSCVLVFEGETKGRVFHKWSTKVCDTDREAYDFLGRVKLENLWAQARSIVA